jgi:predicted metal-dependent peptidase
MNIPKRIKIGDKIFKVKLTDKLVLGDNFTGECLYQNLKIHVRPHLAKSVRESTFIHEILHAIYNNLGYLDHDEKKIEELANALHGIIVDNPELFSNESRNSELKTSGLKPKQVAKLVGEQFSGLRN